MSLIRLVTDISIAHAITHAGTFHADDVFASVILCKLFLSNAKSQTFNIYRTFRIPENLSENIIIYDVGYGKFDHHQKGGNGARKNGIPYSSVGLIWKEFGPQLVAKTCNPELVWEIVDRTLIQGLDAIDNGEVPKLNYPTQPMNLSQTIASFNPTWDSTKSTDEAFLKAVNFAEIIFDNVLASAISKAKAKDVVISAIQESEDHIMILPHFVPWQDVLLSSDSKAAQDIMFVVYPSNRGGFNWHTVPDSMSSFGFRKSVPQSWKGLQGKALQMTSNIPTAIFCHPKGFIGGAETLEDTIALAELAIQS